MPDSRGQKSSSVTAGRVVVGVLVALVVVFAILNSQSVRMHWIVTTSDTPLFIVLLVFVLIGLLIGYFLGHRSGRSRS